MHNIVFLSALFKEILNIKNFFPKTSHYIIYSNYNNFNYNKLIKCANLTNFLFNFLVNSILSIIYIKYRLVRKIISNNKTLN